jgi:hypothetical protein
MTGSAGEKIDKPLHEKLVRLVRDAVPRPLSRELVPMLEKVQKRAQEKDVSADAEGILGEGNRASPEAA